MITCTDRVLLLSSLKKQLIRSKDTTLLLFVFQIHSPDSSYGNDEKKKIYLTLQQVLNNLPRKNKLKFCSINDLGIMKTMYKHPLKYLYLYMVLSWWKNPNSDRFCYCSKWSKRFHQKLDWKEITDCNIEELCKKVVSVTNKTAENHVGTKKEKPLKICPKLLHY